MMRRVSRAALLAVVALLPVGLTDAREGKPAETRTEAPVPAEPSETSASFGDWVVRCQRVGQQGGQDATATRVCEAAQSLLVKGQQAPIAQIAFGRAGTSATMVTVLLPTNVSFDKPPAIGSDAAHMTTMTFRRCLPGGCLASANVDAAGLRELRDAKGTGRLVFTDAAERTLTLPVSFRGLAQALDDLAKAR